MRYAGDMIDQMSRDQRNPGQIHYQHEQEQIQKNPPIMIDARDVSYPEDSTPGISPMPTRMPLEKNKFIQSVYGGVG